MARADDDGGHPLSGRTAVFAVAALMTLTLVGAGSWFWGQETGTSRAVWDARASAELLAARIVEADVIGGLLAGDPAAIQTVDRLVGDQDSKVISVTLWAPDGRAVYPRDAAVLGTSAPLDEIGLQTLQASKSSAELRVPTGDPGDDPVLRVHQPVQPVGGEALLLQIDHDYRAVTADGKRVWRMFAPITLGALLLLGGFSLCLVWLASRRREEPRDWLDHEPLALESPKPAATPATPAPLQTELPSPVHEPDEGGWLGELRGGTPWPAVPFTEPVPYEDVPLPGALRGGGPRPQPSLPLHTLTAQPASGNGNGTAKGKQRSLERALSGMLLPLATRGIDTRLDLPPGVRLSDDTEELLLRAAEEAVRNTMSHAQARTVKVRLDVDDHRVELTVDDDGRGFDPAELSHRPNGHRGLRTLTRLAADAGGALHIRSTPNRGTRLHLDLPAS